MSKKPTHQDYVDDLCRRLSEKKYTDYVHKNVEYSMGECDVLIELEGRKKYRKIYYQIKTNYTKEGYKKCVQQVLRWSEYWHKRTPHIDFYGVYWSPEKVIRVCKNGKQR